MSRGDPRPGLGWGWAGGPSACLGHRVSHGTPKGTHEPVHLKIDAPLYITQNGASSIEKLTPMAFKQTDRLTKRDIASLTTSYPSWTHPDVIYAEEDWELLRDTYAGEREVKGKTVHYLPQPDGMDEDQYRFYIDNATYYNMTARTVGALVGSVFKRNPVISNLPEKLDDGIKAISKDNESLRTFSRRLAKEVLHMGRFGVLVDRPANGNGSPYLVGYVAEAILDWTTTEKDGRNILSEVVLMEIDEIDRVQQNRRQFKPLYRVLRLVNGVYEQHIYRNDANGGAPDINGKPSETYRPTNRGEPLDFIPFMFFGAESNLPNFERSPIVDIARLNISHYRSYAHLEHGRYYTGLPVFYVSKANGESAGSYTIGPSVVWEVAQGEKAGLLEFNGNGLKFLENAITGKESHIATLGGRLIGVDTRSVSESDNQVAMKNRNEQALLLNVTLAMDEGLSKVLRWWAWWQDTSQDALKRLSIEFSKEFLLKEVAAREFRAIHAMYKDAIIPIEVVYDYLLRADVIPDWMTIEEFKELLDSMDSFPNNPDAEAKKDGFPDRKTELSLEDSEAERETAETIAETQAAAQLRVARENAARQARRTQT